MTKLTQKQALLMITGITVALCGLFAGGVYWASGLIEGERIAIEAKEASVRAARKKIDKIRGVENEVIVLRENVANYVKILPQEAELTKFARDSQRFAVLSGISIDRFVPVRGGAKGGAFRRVTYQYYFQSTVWQFMKFMNYFESHKRFARVRDFNLTGSPVTVGEEARHDFRVTVETYVYNPSTKAAVTKISKYEAKAKLLKDEIVTAGNLDLRAPYDFRGREGRRDIFIDPRQMESGDSITPLVDQQAMIEEFGKLVGDLRDKWTHSLAVGVSMFERIELQRSVKSGLQDFEERVGRVRASNLIKSKTLVKRWLEEVQTPYETISREVRNEEAAGSRFLPKTEFLNLIAVMQAKLRAGDLEGVVTQHSHVRSRIEASKESALYKFRLRVEGLVTQAKIGLEFGAMPLEISGVVVQSARKSGVILNGLAYEEGEYISPDLFVKKVRDDEVEFVYKGFTLTKTW
jgi:Tfp pilus assembly protein PilO